MSPVTSLSKSDRVSLPCPSVKTPTQCCSWPTIVSLASACSLSKMGTLARIVLGCAPPSNSPMMVAIGTGRLSSRMKRADTTTRTTSRSITTYAARQTSRRHSTIRTWRQQGCVVSPSQVKVIAFSITSETCVRKR